MSSSEKKPNSYSIVVPKTTINIRSDERVFIAGRTGSGKTTLAKFLLHTAKRLIVIDGKDGLGVDWELTDYEKGSDDRRIKNLETYRIRLVDNMDDIISVLNLAYSVGNTLIYIDEITATIERPTSYPSIFRDIWTRGRSRNIGAWSNTQRPTSIPMIFISEAEHDLVFNLSLESDRKRIRDNIGTKSELKTGDKYGFFYYSVITGKLNYYKGINV